MYWKSFFVSICLLTSLLTASNASCEVDPHPLPTISSTQLWSQGNQHFTTTFYPHAKRSGHNFIFSPISLQTALAMSAELAYGDTQKEILDTTSLPENEFIRREGIETLLNQLNTGVAAGVEPVNLTLTNGAWISSQISVLQDFKTVLNQSYKANISSADFHLSPNTVRQDINHWVDENTLHQIPDLLPENSLNTQTKLVLVNTLYMRAPWSKPFDADMTYEAPFYGLNKSLRPVPFMRKISSFGLLEEDIYTVIELPFKESLSTNDQLSLYIILPKERALLEQVEQKLTTRRLEHWIESPEPQYIDLSLPKFKVASALNAKDVLKSMGMTRPFSSEAEFDLIDQHGKVAITDIFHNAVFEVDEWGGTGSAATGVVIGVTCWREPKQILVNRPFLFLVVDKTSGIILFSGRIMQP